MAGAQRVADEVLRFGRFEIRPAERVLHIDGRSAALGDAMFEQLLAEGRRLRAPGKDVLRAMARLIARVLVSGAPLEAVRADMRALRARHQTLHFIIRQRREHLHGCAGTMKP